jgi:chitinase
MHSTNKASTREKKNIMSSNGMGSRLALVIVCSVLLSLIGTSAATGKTGRITVYWGQTSNEGSLRKACESKLYSTVILSFLNNFGSGKYGLNLAGHSWAAVGPDVKYCQSKKVLVLLAIGGGIGKYSLASKADAKAVAKHLWDYYLGGKSRSRPFGTAVLDGVDFDIELGSRAHYDDLARYLKGYSKKVFVTAAPQCPFPDASLGPALRTGLFDYVWVQFYNNPPCQFNATAGVGNLASAWDRWTGIPAKQVFLGLPAAPAAAGSGFIQTSDLISTVLPVVKKSSKYGGIMLWSRFHDLQTVYSDMVKSSV